VGRGGAGRRPGQRLRREAAQRALVNGGFFCFEPGALEFLGEESVLEREPLRRLAAEGRLRGYRHEGFWDCMDTYKDAIVLNDLWSGGQAPWRLWDAAAVEAP
jgi:glucose-1-phosphate cytidylyltransferase